MLVAWGGLEPGFVENLEEMLENHDGRRPRGLLDCAGRDDESCCVGAPPAALTIGIGTGEEEGVARGLEATGDPADGDADGDADGEAGDCDGGGADCDCRVLRRRLVGFGALPSGTERAG